MLALAGCGYRPAPGVDTQAGLYRKDLDACQSRAEMDVDGRNAKRALAWFASPVTRWGDLSEQTRACMAGKGYGGLRWCTPEEVRAGRSLVTRTGLQCADPATAADRSASPR